MAHAANRDEVFDAVGGEQTWLAPQMRDYVWVSRAADLTRKPVAIQSKRLSTFCTRPVVRVETNMDRHAQHRHQ